MIVAVGTDENVDVDSAGAGVVAVDSIIGVTARTGEQETRNANRKETVLFILKSGVSQQRYVAVTTQRRWHNYGSKLPDSISLDSASLLAYYRSKLLDSIIYFIHTWKTSIKFICTLRRIILYPMRCIWLRGLF